MQREVDRLKEAVVAREAAATEERQWVRLTRRCNNRCRFCHDAGQQDGTILEPAALRDEIRAGRARGATRLVLSGGEPTIHPAFLDLVRYGREVGYTWVQAITNGRMFAYEKLAPRAAAAGLCEATVSMHGHTAALHDHLVGTRGAFVQALRGLRNLLRAGLVVSVDVVVSRTNVRHLADILHFYLALGVHEFDLLHLVPFGRGFDEHRDELFYDPAAEAPYVREALRLGEQPGVSLWTNRWPAPLLEGAEHLIQDPHKIRDEVRGRFASFSACVREGIDPECRGERCAYCFLEHFCETLLETRRRLHEGSFAVVAVQAETAPRLGAGRRAAVERQARAALRLRAETPAALAPALAALPRGDRAALELDVPGAAPPDANARARRIVVRREGDLAAALERREAVIEVPLDRTTAAVARQAIARAPGRVVLRPPGRALLSETLALDLAPAELAAIAALDGARSEDVPACLGAPAVAPRPPTLDLEILGDGGDIDLFAFVDAYVRDHYRTRALGCAACVAASGCPGGHINYVRAHGFGWMAPLRRDGGETP